ncbi:hypothetical protein W03_02500 [Nitrosomonas sp. PY1]|nr:hypothetical protein W03_02500 [Nitrosomonas sp. PY1]
MHSDFNVRDLNKLLLGMVFIELLFVVVYVLNVLWGSPSWVITKLVDLDDEGSIATWFSSMQLFVVGLLFFLKSRHANAIELPSATFFCILGLGFIFLSIDEAAAIHEKINAVLKQTAFMPRFKGDHGIWIYVYVLFAGVLLSLVLRNFFALWKRSRQIAFIMATGLLTFVTGAVLLEIISYQFLRNDITSWYYVMEVALEEFLEMLGISIVLYGALLLLMEANAIEGNE